MKKLTLIGLAVVLGLFLTGAAFACYWDGYGSDYSMMGYGMDPGYWQGMSNYGMQPGSWGWGCW